MAASSHVACSKVSTPYGAAYDSHADNGICPTGAEGAKQPRPEVTDTEEKKSQISADSGLSVTSGSQVRSYKWILETKNHVSLFLCFQLTMFSNLII